MKLPGHIDVNTYLKQKFGHKVYKLALSSGCSCPNRDGTISTGGCSFCSSGGSGEFAASPKLSIVEQIEYGKALLENKLKNIDKAQLSYIAYFQSFTNTYAPVETLRTLFTEAISHRDISILSVATRPDCLSEACIEMLAELNKYKPVWIELGLQTIHDKTAEAINRGYKLAVFNSAVERLRAAGLEVIVHVILGLPGESEAMMLDTIQYISDMKRIFGIKLQLLHVLENTELGDRFLSEKSKLINNISDEEFDNRTGNIDELTARRLGLNITSIEQYIDIIKKCLRILPEDIIIHRITGDAPRKSLIYPGFSTDKKRILNAIKAD